MKRLAQLAALLLMGAWWWAGYSARQSDSQAMRHLGHDLWLAEVVIVGGLLMVIKKREII